MNYYVEPLPDGRAGVVYRMADDGSTAERYVWDTKAWKDDPKLIRKLVDGADLDHVTKAQAEAAIAKRAPSIAEAKTDHFYGAWSGGKAKAGGGPTDIPGADSTDWPPPVVSQAGIDDAGAAWSGTHFADIREFMRTGSPRAGMDEVSDPIHGISKQRCAQTVSTLTYAIATSDKKAPELFRGLRPRATVYQHFAGLKPGETLDMSLSSWSGSKDQATKFANGISGSGQKPLLLRMEAGGQGYRMGRHSLYPTEREWLSNGRFVVKSVEPSASGKGPLVVTLTQQSVFASPAAMKGAS